MTQHSIYIIAAVAAGVVSAAEAASNAGTVEADQRGEADQSGGAGRSDHKSQGHSSSSNNDRRGDQSFDYLGGVVNQRAACSLG